MRPLWSCTTWATCAGGACCGSGGARGQGGEETGAARAQWLPARALCTRREHRRAPRAGTAAGPLRARAPPAPLRLEPPWSPPEHPALTPPRPTPRHPGAQSDIVRVDTTREPPQVIARLQGIGRKAHGLVKWSGGYVTLDSDGGALSLVRLGGGAGGARSVRLWQAPEAGRFLKGLAVVDDIAYFGVSPWAPRSARDDPNSNCELAAFDLANNVLLWRREVPRAGRGRGKGRGPGGGGRGRAWNAVGGERSGAGRRRRTEEGRHKGGRRRGCARRDCALFIAARRARGAAPPSPGRRTAQPPSPPAPHAPHTGRCPPRGCSTLWARPTWRWTRPTAPPTRACCSSRCGQRRQTRSYSARRRRCRTWGTRQRCGGGAWRPAKAAGAPRSCSCCRGAHPPPRLSPH